MVKVLAWYDNEWGFSCQMLNTAARDVRRLKSARRAACSGWRDAFAVAGFFPATALPRNA